MPFEELKKDKLTRRRLGKTISMSISSDMRTYFSPQLAASQESGPHDIYAVVCYDSERQLAALKEVDKDHPDAYRVMMERVNDGSRSTSHRSHGRTLGRKLMELGYEQDKRYIVERNGDGLLVIQK